VAILAAVDDFLFRSKIRAVAKHVNAEIAFAQSADEILTLARASRPSLVIVDLNNQKLDPVAAIAALKGDRELGSIRTIGFASHVHAELIDAARRAGADQVLARSQFAGNLADILASGQSQ
jgi:DNA-binding NarL/FixJ family response regulator